MLNHINKLCSSEAMCTQDYDIIFSIHNHIVQAWQKELLLTILGAKDPFPSNQTSPFICRTSCVLNNLSEMLSSHIYLSRQKINSKSLRHVWYWKHEKETWPNHWYKTAQLGFHLSYHAIFNSKKLLSSRDFSLGYSKGKWPIIFSISFTTE